MKIFAVSVVVLLLGIVGILNPLRDATQYVFSPIQYGLQNSAKEIKNTVYFFKNVSNIRQENIALTSENLALRSRVDELKIYEEENNALKNALELKTDPNFEQELLFAKILGNPTDPTGSKVYIDKGSKHGVVINDNVVVGKNLVGVVTATSLVRSEVTLLTHPSINVTVYDIDTSPKTEGLLVGKYGTSLDITRILPNEIINTGDLILTSGKDGIFEPDLVVGTVGEILQESSEPLKSATVNSVIDLRNLDKVFVLLNK